MKLGLKLFGSLLLAMTLLGGVFALMSRSNEVVAQTTTSPEITRNLQTVCSANKRTALGVDRIYKFRFSPVCSNYFDYPIFFSGSGDGLVNLKSGKQPLKADLESACTIAASATVNLPLFLGVGSQELLDIQAVCRTQNITIADEESLARCNPLQLAWDWAFVTLGENCATTANRVDGMAFTVSLICRMKNTNRETVAAISGNTVSEQIKNICATAINYGSPTDDASFKTDYASDGARFASFSAGVSSQLCTIVKGSLDSLNLAERVRTSLTSICRIDSEVRADQREQNGSCSNTDPVAALTCTLKSIFDAFAGSLVALLAVLVSFVSFILAYLMKFVVFVLAVVANELLLINPASNTYFPVSREVFGIFANLVNLIILFLFVKTGLDFIFNDKKTPDISNFIITVAVIAIGVQFSFSLAAAFMALSYNIGYIFLQAIAPGEVNPFLAFRDAVDGAFAGSATQNASFVNGLSGYLAALVNGSAGDVVGPLVGSAAVQFTRVLVLAFTIYLLLQFVIKFAIRAVTMFFVLITAPVGFVFLVADGLDKDIKKYGEDWWNALLFNSLTYPVIVIGLGIGARLVQQITALNSGEDFTLQGFNLFDPTSWAVVISPLIRALLPAVVALGTLALLDEWIEKNLKPMAGSLTSRIVKGVGSGFNSTVKAYRGGITAAGRTSGFFAGGGLRSGLNSLVNTMTLGGFNAVRDRFSARKAIAGITDPKERAKAYKDEFKRIRLNRSERMKEAIVKAGTWGEYAQGALTSDGVLNPLNNNPFKLKIDQKTGAFSFVKNKNSSFVIATEGAVAQGAGEDNAVMIQRIRQNAFTTAETARVEALSDELGLPRSVFAGMNGFDLERLKRQDREKYSRLVGSSVTAAGQRAASKIYKLDDEKSLPSVGDLTRALNFALADVLEEDGKVNITKLNRTFEVDQRLRNYFEALLKDPDKYKEAIDAQPELRDFIESFEGVKWLTSTFSDPETVSKIMKLYTTSTGLTGFTEKELRDLRSEGSRSGDANLIAIANSIENQQRKSGINIQENNPLMYNNVDAARAAYDQATRQQQPQEAALSAIRGNARGIATNTDEMLNQTEIIEEAQLINSSEITSRNMSDLLRQTVEQTQVRVRSSKRKARAKRIVQGDEEPIIQQVERKLVSQTGSVTGPDGKVAEPIRKVVFETYGVQSGVSGDPGTVNIAITKEKEVKRDEVVSTLDSAFQPGVNTSAVLAANRTAIEDAVAVLRTPGRTDHDEIAQKIQTSLNAGNVDENAVLEAQVAIQDVWGNGTKIKVLEKKTETVKVNPDVAFKNNSQYVKNIKATALVDLQEALVDAATSANLNATLTRRVDGNAQEFLEVVIPDLVDALDTELAGAFRLSRGLSEAKKKELLGQAAAVIQRAPEAIMKEQIKQTATGASKSAENMIASAVFKRPEVQGQFISFIAAKTGQTELHYLAAESYNEAENLATNDDAKSLFGDLALVQEREGKLGSAAGKKREKDQVFNEVVLGFTSGGNNRN